VTVCLLQKTIPMFDVRCNYWLVWYCCYNLFIGSCFQKDPCYKKIKIGW
jgi:hypothetical protein